MGKMRSLPVYASRGIVAGSQSANYELRALVHAEIRLFCLAHANCSLCLHVDDSTLLVLANSEARAVDILGSAASAWMRPSISLAFLAGPTRRASSARTGERSPLPALAWATLRAKRPTPCPTSAWILHPWVRMPQVAARKGVAANAFVRQQSDGPGSPACLALARESAPGGRRGTCSLPAWPLQLRMEPT